MKNILVAIDEYEAVTTDSPIVEQTVQLASAFTSKVWILHIVPAPRQAPFNIDNSLLRKESSGELRQEHEHLHHLAHCLRERSVDAKALLVEGSVVKTILRESERLNIDLIIMGCHRHGLLYKALSEGSAEGLLGRCLLPILFVPMGGG
ncbi:MAG: universal stress protein [Gammaproteobacteria bacterium]